MAACAGCGWTSSKVATARVDESYEPPVVTGHLRSSRITESSGIAASPCQAGVYWTHNDSGAAATIFAVDLEGRDLGAWNVTNAANIDWEDIAAARDKDGNCYVYIGEIGDNKTVRPEHAIYRVPEPRVATRSSSDQADESSATLPAEVMRFSYPADNFDAETLMVHPLSGDIYVLTKRVSGPSGVFRLRPGFGQQRTQQAERVADLAVPSVPNGSLTGGDISPDGRRFVVCDYARAYEYSLPAGEKEFDKIWAATPLTIDIGKRRTGESIGYSADGKSIIAGSEGKGSAILEVRRRAS